MADVQVFSHPDFGGVRVIGDFDNPRFCLSDVCKILELPQVAKVVQRLDKDVLSTHPLETAGGIQQMYFVNEDGLYDLILDSRKPAAKKFRKWVTNEVLPSIRKTSSYSLLNKPSVEAGLQKVGLLVRVAEHKAVPQSEQLRLLNMAVRELTGTELNIGKALQDLELGIMELPEVFGMIKRKKSKKFGKYTFYFYPVIEIADRLGISPLKFN